MGDNSKIENEVLLFGVDYDLCDQCGAHGDCDCEEYPIYVDCPACGGTGDKDFDYDPGDCDVCLGTGSVDYY